MTVDQTDNLVTNREIAWQKDTKAWENDDGRRYSNGWWGKRVSKNPP